MYAIGSNSAKSSGPNSGLLSGGKHSPRKQILLAADAGPATRRPPEGLAWAARLYTGPSGALSRAIWSGQEVRALYQAFPPAEAGGSCDRSSSTTALACKLAQHG